MGSIGQAGQTMQPVEKNDSAPHVPAEESLRSSFSFHNQSLSNAARRIGGIARRRVARQSFRNIMDVKRVLSIRDKASLAGDLLDASSPTIHELEREAHEDTSRLTS